MAQMVTETRERIWVRREVPPEHCLCHRCGWISPDVTEIGPVKELFAHWRNDHPKPVPKPGEGEVSKFVQVTDWKCSDDTCERNRPRRKEALDTDGRLHPLPVTFRAEYLAKHQMTCGYCGQRPYLLLEEAE